jgi:DNA-binding transcriptional ArsR family regulator
MEIAMESASVVRALGALAQEHRLAAFRRLVEAGPDGLPAGRLAEVLGIAPSSMSFHLAQLMHAGLVTQRRNSRSMIYAADFDAMAGVMSYLTDNCCGGAPCAPSVACAVPAQDMKDVA